MDPTYTPPELETRQVYGINLQQRRNDARIDATLFSNIVTENKEASPTESHTPHTRVIDHMMAARHSFLPKH